MPEIYGWGFSLVYTRAAWQACPFLHIGLGEDLDFVMSLRELWAPLIFVPDRRGICAHTQHLANISGACLKFSGRGVIPASLMYSPLCPLLSWYDGMARGLTKNQQEEMQGRENKVAAVPKPVVDGQEAAWNKVRAMKIGRKRTKPEVIAMQDDLIRAFILDSFQDRLEAVWAEPAPNARKKEVRRRDVCLEVQGPIIERHGFENSHRGLFQSSIDCSLVDPEVGVKDLVCKWLTHPDTEEWRILRPQLSTVFR